MGLRIQVAPDKIIAIPAEIEATGGDAMDAYVLTHTGVDLAARRQEAADRVAKARAEAEAAEAADVAASEQSAAAVLGGPVLINPQETNAGDGEEE